MRKQDEVMHEMQIYGDEETVIRRREVESSGQWYLGKEWSEHISPTLPDGHTIVDDPWIWMRRSGIWISRWCEALKLFWQAPVCWPC